MLLDCQQPPHFGEYNVVAHLSVIFLFYGLLEAVLCVGTMFVNYYTPVIIRKLQKDSSLAISIEMFLDAFTFSMVKGRC